MLIVLVHFQIMIDRNNLKKKAMEDYSISSLRFEVRVRLLMKLGFKRYQGSIRSDDNDSKYFITNMAIYTLGDIGYKPEYFTGTEIAWMPDEVFKFEIQRKLGLI